jgi:hypothetical protein
VKALNYTTAHAVHVNDVTLASCVLHNYLRHKPAKYSPKIHVKEVDIKSKKIILGQWSDSGDPLIPLQCTALASNDLAK